MTFFPPITKLAAPDTRECHSQTMLNMISIRPPNRVYPCSTMCITMVSHGTTWRATTKSRLSAKIHPNCWTMLVSCKRVMNDLKSILLLLPLSWHLLNNEWSFFFSLASISLSFTWDLKPPHILEFVSKLCAQMLAYLKSNKIRNWTPWIVWKCDEQLFYAAILFKMCKDILNSTPSISKTTPTIWNQTGKISNYFNLIWRDKAARKKKKNEKFIWKTIVKKIEWENKWTNVFFTGTEETFFTSLLLTNLTIKHKNIWK